MLYSERREVIVERQTEVIREPVKTYERPVVYNQPDQRVYYEDRPQEVRRVEAPERIEYVKEKKV